MYVKSSDDYPKRLPLTANNGQLLPNLFSFRLKANDLSTLLPAELEHHQLINHFSSPPWQFSTSCKEHISAFVPRIDGRADNTASKRQNSLTHIALYQADFTIYNDSSAAEGTRNGGTAALLLEDLPHTLKH